MSATLLRWLRRVYIGPQLHLEDLVEMSGVMRRFLLAIALACGLPVTVGTAFMLRAQSILYQYQRRQKPDRYEGIQVRYQMAGERLDLVSAIARGGLTSSRTADRIFVGFTADENQSVSITVRDLESHYWMEPIDPSGRKIVKARLGFNSFAWDATDVNYIQRKADELYALVERIGGGDVKVLPALLWDSASRVPSELQVDEYEFDFVPNERADISYQIQSTSGKTLMSGDLEDEPKGRVVPIRWKPIGQKDGIYQLNGKATFHFVAGTPPSTTPIHITFVHVGEIRVEP